MSVPQLVFFESDVPYRSFFLTSAWVPKPAGGSLPRLSPTWNIRTLRRKSNYSYKQWHSHPEVRHHCSLGRWWSSSSDRCCHRESSSLGFFLRSRRCHCPWWWCSHSRHLTCLPWRWRRPSAKSQSTIWYRCYHQRDYGHARLPFQKPQNYLLLGKILLDLPRYRWKLPRRYHYFPPLP